ncbi:MAG: hypothetical protein JRD89_09470, partial [Deltaproteobacteria bacterium]|nr:hypothetical protein [Deltaproteobacteria bacterium]
EQNSPVTGLDIKMRWINNTHGKPYEEKGTGDRNAEKDGFHQMEIGQPEHIDDIVWIGSTNTMENKTECRP